MGLEFLKNDISPMFKRLPFIFLAEFYQSLGGQINRSTLAQCCHMALQFSLKIILQSLCSRKNGFYTNVCILIVSLLFLCFHISGVHLKSLPMYIIPLTIKHCGPLMCMVILGPQNLISTRSGNPSSLIHYQLKLTAE